MCHKQKMGIMELTQNSKTSTHRTLGLNYCIQTWPAAKSAHQPSNKNRWVQVSAATHRATEISWNVKHQREISWIIFQPASEDKEIHIKCSAATCEPVSLPGFVLHFNFGTDLKIRSLFETTAGARGKKERSDRDMEWRRLRQGKEKNKHRGGFRQKSSLCSLLFFGRGDHSVHGILNYTL